MRILISGVCGFVGSKLAFLLASNLRAEIIGIDNLSRSGSPFNVPLLAKAGVQFVHGDVRVPSDIEPCGSVDWIIDAAAIPSVLAGIGRSTSSRQVVETNLLGTLNLLEFAKFQAAGFVLLSSSRVYSIRALSQLPLSMLSDAYQVQPDADLPTGVTAAGIAESYSTAAPVSLYGATKLASEALALEYHHAFDMPVWVNRCGVLAGAGQFGKAEQGIFAYWLHAWRDQQPLKYIGFGGTGYQTRDCLHPSDLAELIAKQIAEPKQSGKPRIVNVSGGMSSATSLKQLSLWCEDRWGARPVQASSELRPYDLPWIVLDHASASAAWDWQPKISTHEILSEIADFADQHPNYG